MQNLFAGDVEKALTDLIDVNGVNADVVFVDPPRKGIDETSVNNLLSLKPKKIVYVSCNPASLMRDLKRLEKGYEVKKIIPVDLFPWTSHVECVAVVEIRDSIK